MGSPPKWVYWLLAIFSLFWVLGNLGNQYLWQDEAQTSLISKTILEHGIPMGSDGKNSFSQEQGAEFGDDFIWKWHTWLPFYAQALFFFLFGESNFVARLPFALFGLGSLYFAYKLSGLYWKDERKRLILLILMLSNISLMILLRQARLYSPSIFFTIGTFYYLQALINNKVWAKELLTVFLILLFHSHYFYYATMLLTIGIYLIFFRRGDFMKALWPLGLSAIVNIPWLIWFGNFRYFDSYSANLSSGEIFGSIQLNLQLLYHHTLGGYLILITLFVAFIAVLYRKPRIQVPKNIFFITIFILVNLLLLAIVSPHPFYRYLSVLIIPSLILVAEVVYIPKLIHGWLPYALALALTVIQPVEKYLYELTNDYDGPIEGITEYLKAHANKDDTVLITYGDMPVKWYTGLKTFGGLTGESLMPAAISDWVIVRSGFCCEVEKISKEFVRDQINLNNYNKIEIPYPDYIFENREEPDLRIFYPVKNQNVIIYKKK
ncbi:MAG: glycosyltransferase family 39 protein [Cyclobacteriaceae bacterium]